MNYDELYNSAIGVAGVWECDTVEELEGHMEELHNNPDFTYLGEYSSTQAIDEELEYQGFSLNDITKMSMNRYGNCLEVFHDIENGTYYAFIGAR